MFCTTLWSIHNCNFVCLFSRDASNIYFYFPFKFFAQLDTIMRVETGQTGVKMQRVFWLLLLLVFDAREKRCLAADTETDVCGVVTLNHWRWAPSSQRYWLKIVADDVDDGSSYITHLFNSNININRRTLKTLIFWWFSVQKNCRRFCCCWFFCELYALNKLARTIGCFFFGFCKLIWMSENIY